jgi:hypothetical protein
MTLTLSGFAARTPSNGTIISHSRAILAWVREQPDREEALKRVP